MFAAENRPLAGVSSPRLAPPTPLSSLVDEYLLTAVELGMDPMPWQQTAARYVYARGEDRWLYPEVAVVVARQNGKTSLLKPHIVLRMKMGRRILHTAQNRALPRETFLEVAAAVAGADWIDDIRQANGQETIKAKNGGRYTLVAPRPGVRGFAVDDVILDEVREQHNFELMAAIKPTTTASRDRQILYLSNAGDSDSVVLNDLRRRGEDGDRLAYLEWSAAPERTLDDRRGWEEANPALGITIQEDTLADFYEDYRTSQPDKWETEHLCRWVISSQPRLVADASWVRCQAALEEPLRPVMGISMDPEGSRASAVLAWVQTDGSFGLRVDADVTGAPIDVDRLGPDLKERALRVGATEILYDPWTDETLARHFRKARPVGGREYANASAAFVRAIESGRLHWDVGGQLGQDLAWTARKPHDSGAWMAVTAHPDHPVTAVLAAIRAVGAASGPQPGAPRIM